jgi:trigger factor
LETPRPAQKEDFVKVSYSVVTEGETSDGKKIENQLVELNSNALFLEVQNALIGANAGETKEVSVVVPENYQNPVLVGKTLKFTITLDSVESMKLAELNDELAKKLGYESIEQAKSKILANMKHDLDERKSSAAFDQIVEQVLARNTFDVAECLVESTLDRVVEEARSQGDKEPNRDALRSKALKNVQGILALGHIARQEAVTVADDEVTQSLLQFARETRMDLRQLLKNGNQVIEEFRGQIMVRKVLSKIIDMATVQFVAESEMPTAD